MTPDLAQNAGRFDGSGHSSPRATRSQSMSSDRPSMSGYGGLFSPPVLTAPEPGFIAASAASQIVTNDHDSQSDVWFDQYGIEPSGETALVAVPALKLLNSFLDQLLFNFLLISHSTSLAALRSAVLEVLKPKLAKDAISGAEQELHEYLGGGEDEELLEGSDGLEGTADWDLELVWKRTRLRCMVYSSLGDMEEEDEDYYTEQEHLEGHPDSAGNSGVVSPTVAIFLTSILEYMGEQILVVASQAAFNRLRAKHEKEERDGTAVNPEIADRVVVEESDMERVALDRTLGRLWRGWKKRIRSPATSMSMSRSFSRESMRSQAYTSRAATATPDDHISEDARRLSSTVVPSELERAAGIPLPISDEDIREIEIPGLADQSDDEDDDTLTEDEDVRPPPRPKSLVIFTHSGYDIMTPTQSEPQIPLFLSAKSRTRSNSMPSAPRAPYKSPSPKPPIPAPNAPVEGQDGAPEETTEGTVEGTPEEILEKSVPKVPGDFPEEETSEAIELPEAKNEDHATTEDPTMEHSDGEDHVEGLATALVAGAGVVGAAAAINRSHQTKQEVHGESDNSNDVVEEFTEEPQILTSSRISIGGRISPESLKGISRASSVRSQGARSLRLIDVAAPKSPTRLVDAVDQTSAGKTVTLSRPSSTHSSIAISRGMNGSPLAREDSVRSSRHYRNSAAESISEIAEPDVDRDDSPPTTGSSTNFATAMEGVYVEPNHPTSQLNSEHVSREVVEQPAAFVLSAAPPARNMRENSQAAWNDLQTTQTIANGVVTAKSTGHESVATPLTPLNESIEGPMGAPAEAFSATAKSYGAQRLSEYTPNESPISASPHSSSHSQRAVDPIRTPEHPRPVRQATSSTTRSSPPRLSRDGSIRKALPETMSKTQRSTHTSGSMSSPTSHKLKALRTSEEMTAAEDKSESFEQLIRSDQTIQYTLTPQNMRNIESPAAPSYGSSAIVNGQDGSRRDVGHTKAGSVTKYTGLHSNPLAESPKSLISSVRKPVNASSPNTGTRVRANAPQARDARVDRRESTGDFAEFIRTTSPPDSHDPAVPRSVSSRRDSKSTAPRNLSISAPSIASSNTPTKFSEPSIGRSRLQPRDATVNRGDSISDLIDFVRAGPQLEKDNHRISRTVAPFRSTMDSDQMSGAVGGRAVDASLPDPRYSQASTSVHSSVNSQSALISHSAKMNKSLPAVGAKLFDEENMMPKRKTRRVRDPYAINFSDDEDDYEATSRPKPIQEESLAEFLRNVPPPPDSAATPVFSTPPVNVDARRRTSTTGILRFGRNSSATQLPHKATANGHDISSSAARRSPHQVTQHAPISAQFSTSQPSTYKPTGDYGSRLDPGRNPATGKVAQKAYEPRAATYTSSRTNDLAEFLRSEPPPNNTPPRVFAPPAVSAPQKDEPSGFAARVFGRRKKVAGY